MIIDIVLRKREKLYINKLEFGIIWIFRWSYIFNHIVQVIKVVYPLGDITDPVTGKKIVAGQYRYVDH